MSISDYEQRLLDQSSQREIDAHDEAVKRAIDNGQCVKCGYYSRVELLPRAIKFCCLDSRCGWVAFYPIAIIGNSDRSAIYTTREAVKAALISVIDGGDPATPTNAGSPIWSTNWTLYPANEVNTRTRFADAVVDRLTQPKES